jgi:hypothetical protein
VKKMAKWKNERGEWVALNEKMYGWVDYKKQEQACKNCKNPWNMGAINCADMCQRGIIYLLERSEHGTVLYTAKIDNNGKAIADEKIIEVYSLLTMNQLMMFFKEHGIAQQLP